MSNISAEAVKKLRERTGLPMMKCKEALTRAGGDMDKAIDIIRTETKADVRWEERETADGRIAVYIDAAKQTACILELRCESAPVAKSEQFVKLANDLARIVVEKDPKTPEELIAATSADGKTGQDLIADVMSIIRESMKVKRFVRLTGGFFGTYVHHDGSKGVLVQANGAAADPALLKDVSMHITAYVPTPIAARRDEVAADVVAKEMEIAKGKAIATGKPAQIAEKIAEGQMKSWYAEHVLIEQPFVKDPSKTVGQLFAAAGLEVVKFVRYQIGEVTA